MLMKLLQPLFDWAMWRALRDRFPSDELERMTQDAWRNYADLAQNLPAESTLGARLMVRLAVMTAALYKSLCEAGLTEEEARESASQVTWLVYEKAAMPPWKLTCLLVKKPLARVKKAMNWFIRFPYAAPGYDMRCVNAGEDAVAFDVYRCPAADYFTRQRLSELCVIAWCNLDYPLADNWGMTLERAQTLAGGESHCDFRFQRLSK